MWEEMTSDEERSRGMRRDQGGGGKRKEKEHQL